SSWNELAANARKQLIGAGRQRVAAPGDVLVGTYQRIAGLIKILQHRLARLQHFEWNTRSTGASARAVDCLCVRPGSREQRIALSEVVVQGSAVMQPGMRRERAGTGVRDVIQEVARGRL